MSEHHPPHPSTSKISATPIRRSATAPTHQTPTLSTPPPSTTRKSPQSREDKIEEVFSALRRVRWSLTEFLKQLLQQEKRSPTNNQRVRTMLDGTAKPYLGEIVELLYQNSMNTDPRGENQPQPYAPGSVAAHIGHARSAMETWAVTCSGEIVQREGEEMIRPSTGLHLRATAKEGGPHRQYKVTWNKVDSFTLDKLHDIAMNHAPATSHLMMSYIHNPGSESLSTSNLLNATQALRERRPDHLVVTDSIMSLTAGRSRLANFLPMCRGIWLFATKAPKTLYRVESRLGHSVALSTTINALKAMAEETKAELHAYKKPVSVVFDNTQAYARVREHGLGKQSQMITGLAGTAVELEEFEPGSLDLQPLLDNQARQDRLKLTADMIQNDLDVKHLADVAAVQFLRRLIFFSPNLKARYHAQLEEFTKKTIAKKPISPDRLSNVMPLATNSANEMTPQGMQRGILDFLETQLGINSETTKHDQRVQLISGDGKTFGTIHHLKKLKAMDPDHFLSFRSLVTFPEIWHTRWTDQSRLIRGHWGEISDPFSLAQSAKKAELPTPSDFRKVDYYQGLRLVDLVLTAQILNCWELEFGSTALETYFDEGHETSTIPSFDDLVKRACTLADKHATTHAYHNALSSGDAGDSDIEMSSASSSSSDNLSELGDPPKSTKSDFVLANSALFMRDAIWSQEAREAVTEGDAGRVLEILRVWIFTFAGSGNPFYTQYLLEVYCCFKWEWPDQLQEAVLKNWLVNLHGKPGHFLERDLMQEHFNFWLEDMAQHKGKEFDQPFYRNVLSMNVLHFIRLKDEMEEVVSLKKRSKRHSDAGTSAELKALMTALRDAKVNQRHDGRMQGHLVTDDFHVGLQSLKKDRIKNFIQKSSMVLKMLQMQRSEVGEANRSAGASNDDDQDAETEFQEFLDQDIAELLPVSNGAELRMRPPPRGITIEGEYSLVDDELQDID